jgi:hypothetical protein
MLYHYSTHPVLATASAGDTFTLRPGAQGAEGLGVYFAERPRLQAADAIASGVPCTGCVVIDRPAAQAGWFVTKLSLARKFGRPRTWHTCGRSLTLTVVSVEGVFFHCRVNDAA